MGYFTPEDMSEDNFQGKSICHFEITKAEVEAEDFDRLDEFMETLKHYGSTARQKVLFSFAGYDEDKREIVFIPETLQYTKQLISRHPYIWYYALPFNSEFLYLAILLGQENMTVATIPIAKKFAVKQDPCTIMRLITVMARNMEIFGEEIDDIEGSVESLKLWSNKILSGNQIKL
jgi:hypothetical protein